MKFLLWGVIAAVAGMWLLRTKKRPAQPDVNRCERSGNMAGNSEAMVQCVQCGIYIPASEAILTQPNAAFCSEEHRLQHLSA